MITVYPAPTQPVSAVSLPLPANAAQETNGNLANLYALEQISVASLLQQILVELRVVTAVLGIGLNVTDDPNTYRNDPSFSQVN